MNKKEFAKYIDHTNLKKDLSYEEIEKLCKEAIHWGFFSVCIHRKFLQKAEKFLEGSSVIPITVIGFPKGTESTEEKVRQTGEAVLFKAKELDMVINLELLKKKNYKGVFEDIEAVVKASCLPVKVIIETSELTENEKIIASSLSVAAGALYVKTSTGTTEKGAAVEDVKLIKQTVSSFGRVKASGQIKTLEQALKMIEAGADRIGTSSSVQMMENFI